MKDALDFLKKDWKKQDKDLPKLSYDEIYKMIWKKSSSIVRWIFVISIVELFLSAFISIVLADENYWREIEKLNLKGYTIALYIISYLVTFYFIYRFYHNYKKISNTDTTITLMENILKTRKTVKTYIAYVLISSGISGLIVTVFNAIRISNGELEMAVNIGWLQYTLITFAVLTVFLTLLWLFYKLIYGILLKKLKKNYKQLKKLEL